MNILILCILIVFIIGLILGYFAAQIIFQFHLKKTDSYLRHLATHDTLTGLPNRLLLVERFQLAIAISKHFEKQNFIACVFFNLNDFKSINRSFGRKIGDLLLKKIAGCLAKTIKDKDTLACYGGDIFVIVLTTLDKEKDILFLIKKYMAIFSKPFVINGHEISITCSMGISYYPYDGKNAEVLLENAESVMVSAKSRSPGNNFLFYSDEIHTNITKLLELTTDLQHALKHHQFFLLYQPIINLKNGRIQGVEALIRWNHPKHGLISPEVFIPLAEKSELINTIGDWVLRTACLQHQEWMKKGLPRLCMAVNFSYEQFKQHNLDEKIRQILKETKMDPNCLEIEVTEHGIIDTNNIMLNKFIKITNQGIKFAVDDFGTGYSTFKYLQEFPIHTLKIDQSFIKNIDFDPENTAIVNAMICMAKMLKIKVIAEGIETESQLRILKKIQCAEGQGYYFSKPIDAESITKLVQEKTQW